MSDRAKDHPSMSALEKVIVAAKSILVGRMGQTVAPSRDEDATEIAWAVMSAADECDHSTHYASTNPETNADRECLATHIATALRAYAEEARREKRPDGCTCTKVIIHEGGCPAIRARKEKGT